ncbi:MAG: sulfurtransferase TusA family protein [Candidatus Bathyarchaeia archaeon]
MTELQHPKKLDLTGQVCPWPVVLTLKEIKKLSNDDVLEVTIDHFPSTLNIPEAVKKDGHIVIGSNRVADGVYSVTIKVNK